MACGCLCLNGHLGIAIIWHSFSGEGLSLLLAEVGCLLVFGCGGVGCFKEVFGFECL